MGGLYLWITGLYTRTGLCLELNRAGLYTFLVTTKGLNLLAPTE